MTNNPESLPDSADLGGPCPRCGRVAAFELIGASTPLKPDGSERVITVKCMGCQDSIVVVERMVGPVPTGFPLAPAARRLFLKGFTGGRCRGWVTSIRISRARWVRHTPRGCASSQ